MSKQDEFDLAFAKVMSGVATPTQPEQTADFNPFDAALAKVYTPSIAQKQQPITRTQPVLQMAARQQPASPVGSSILEGIGQGFVSAGRGAKQLIDGPAAALERWFDGGKLSQALGMPTAAASKQQTQDAIDEAKKLDAPLLKTSGGMIGSMVGNAAATAPLMAAGGAGYGAAAATGGLLGLLQPVAAGENRALNTVVGAGGGLLGRGLTGMAAKLAQPIASKLSPEGQRLAAAAQKEGINLDVAQLTGSKALNLAKSVLADMPLTSGRSQAAQAAQQTAFNRAVMAKTGQVADDAAPSVIESAQKRIGGNINEAVAGQKINLGDDFRSAVAAVQKEYGNVMDPLKRQEFNRIVDFIPKNVKGLQIDGKAYQNTRSMLGQKASGMIDDPYARQAYQGLQSAFDDAAQASLPAGRAAQLIEARGQYGPLMAIEKAMTKASGVDGNISGTALRQAVAQQNPKTFVRGAGQLNDLARIGQLFINDGIANSKSPARTGMQNLLTGNLGGLSLAALGGGAGYASGADPATIGLLAGGALLGPKAAQIALLSEAAKKLLIAGPKRQAAAKFINSKVPQYTVPAGSLGLLQYLQPEYQE